MADRKARMRRNKVNSDIRAEGRALQTPRIKNDPSRPMEDEQGMSLQRRRVGPRTPSMTGDYSGVENAEGRNRRAPKMPRYDDSEVDVSPRAERDDQMMIGKKRGGKIKKMKSGGKVRGCGMASKGVRAAKMVKMKGA